MRIVLMGPPGAGKGTQAKRLVQTFAMRHLSSGDLLRAERASGSALGATLQRYMGAGELVPDEIVVDVMARAMSGPDEKRGIVLDGFPRTVAQAEALDRQLERLRAPLEAVVVIDADRDEIVERITGRRSCPRCGKVYHVKFLPPRREGVCDECGRPLVQRDDDTDAVVRQRMEAYVRQTEPVIDYYRRRMQVFEIDGGGTADGVTRRIVEVLRACSRQG